MFIMRRRPLRLTHTDTLFHYTTLLRSLDCGDPGCWVRVEQLAGLLAQPADDRHRLVVVAAAGQKQGAGAAELVGADREPAVPTEAGPRHPHPGAAAVQQVAQPPHELPPPLDVHGRHQEMHHATNPHPPAALAPAPDPRNRIHDAT